MSGSGANGRRKQRTVLQLDVVLEYRVPDIAFSIPVINYKRISQIIT